MIKLRAIFIGLITIAVLLVVYLLYSNFNNTSPIVINTTVAPDANTPEIEFDKQVGKVSEGVGVGSVQKAYFFDLNPKTQEMEREFGFSKLLHEEGDEWEIEQPYMNVYRPDFKCSITADYGRVMLETESSKPTPKDATLKGNVIIHIEPAKDSSVKKSTIYLDEVVFLSKKSQFSTSGPVHFVNEDAEMIGRGMELIYNQQLERLEILKIVQLQILKIRSDAESSLFASDNDNQEDEKTTVSKTKPKSQQNTTVAKNPEPQSVEQPQPPTKKQKRIEKYKCVLDKNVFIDCPEQLIFSDKIIINNIRSGSSDDNDDDQDQSQPQQPQEKVAQAPADPAPKPSKPKAPVVTDAPQKNLPIVPAKGIDDDTEKIVITCDGGVLFVPMDATLDVSKYTSDITQIKKDALPESIKDANDYRAKFIATSIAYDADTEETLAKDNTELIFYQTEKIGSKRIKLPVSVKAVKVEFMPVKNKVVFQGKCRCHMTKPEKGYIETYNLSSNQMIIDLENKKSKDGQHSDTDIKHLRAVGGTVRLSNIKKVAGKQIGGVELKCRQFDYTTENEFITAKGPDGMIKVDNSNIQASQDQTQVVALKKPCWAVVQYFDTLHYSTITNILDISGQENGMLHIDYIPIDKSSEDQHIEVTSNKLNIKMTEDSEIISLHASGGIIYDEHKPLIRNDKQGDPVYFEADEFLFESATSIITATGTNEKPARLDNASLESIKYNLQTGRIIKAKFKGSAIF